ncbi:MAG: hypothetical protein FWF05_01585 [Oscillospiraceae bacterium]|nr:hypothetical protein [Oscillospiraceae bacterium]
MKKIYEKPELSVERFEIEDVITASGITVTTDPATTTISTTTTTKPGLEGDDWNGPTVPTTTNTTVGPMSPPSAFDLIADKLYGFFVK